jgi:hypothetical protein
MMQICAATENRFILYSARDIPDPLASNISCDFLQPVIVCAHLGQMGSSVAVRVTECIKNRTFKQFFFVVS